MFIHFVTGLTAFDFISDFEEWIECGYFNEEIKARLKGKHLGYSNVWVWRKRLTNFLYTCDFLFLILMAHYWVSQVAEQQTEQRQERCYVAAARAEEKSPMVPNPNPKQY